jgi:AcrR family transcriptional regulator
VARRGEDTKKRLLDAAERLFAARGIDSVSLRQVNAAAGERNNAALYYHFHDRDGLVRAIVERHYPRQVSRQRARFDAAARDDRLSDFRTLVEILVRPAADDLKAGVSERAWLRISGELLTRPQTAAEDITASVDSAAYEAGTRVVHHLVEDSRLPRDFVVQRVRTVFDGVAFMIASRARFEDASERRRDAPPIELFIEDLVDITCAALEAPMSDQAANFVEHPASGSSKSLRK